MSDVLILETTVGSADDARILADAVVAERLAACAQVVGPIESVYWWDGAVTGASEWLVRCKTTRGRSAALVRRLRELHPYEVPELVLLEPAGVDEPYAAWVRESVEEEPRPTAGEGPGPSAGEEPGPTAGETPRPTAGAGRDRPATGRKPSRGQAVGDRSSGAAAS
jgi:periplasmic divalent cation tolerance protein